MYIDMYPQITIDYLAAFNLLSVTSSNDITTHNVLRRYRLRNAPSSIELIMFALRSLENQK